MIDGFNERVNEKYKNLDFILCSMFKNITKYTNNIRIVFKKLKENVCFNKHKQNMLSCFDMILFSPKGQVENKTFNIVKLKFNFI